MNTDPVAACSAAGKAAQERYAAKDVAGMLVVAEAGIAEALRAADANADLAPELRRAAKKLAYNVAAKGGPGWGDEGIVIDAEIVARGLSLAEQSRALVLKLDLGDRERGTADWLVGALEMAAARTEAAINAFDEACAAFRAARAEAQVLMAEGYRALARKLAAPEDEAAADDFAAACRRLAELGSKEAGFFRHQLLTADEILAARLRKPS